MLSKLVEVDELEAIVIVDNEVDVMSGIALGTIEDSRRFPDIALGESHDVKDVKAGGVPLRIMPMEGICCGAHGLSVMATATRSGVKRSLLFDTGPEEAVFEENVKRLGVDVASIDLIQLSHWHRDHSGGMLKAVEMISKAKERGREGSDPVLVDLHPARPEYRGFMIKGETIALPADPTIAELRKAGGAVLISPDAHTVLDDMFLVSGFIESSTAYEQGLKNGIRIDDMNKGWEQDEEVADERFLICNVKDKGIIMLTGCSHRGVVNASRSAVDHLSGKIPLHAVLGGYHLAGSTQSQVEETVQDLKALDPKVLLPGHCSGWRVKHEIEKQMPGRLVPCTVGSKIKF